MSVLPKMIVALDFSELTTVERLVDQLPDRVGWYKIGKQLFTRYGPAAVECVKATGRKVFLDLKFHDIPNTVSKAVTAATHIGADMVNVHASGGRAMMAAAAEAAANSDAKVIAVTVLTSMDDEALRDCGVHDPVEQQVARLAMLAQKAGLDGVVASVREVPTIRSHCSEKFCVVTPGVRPAGSSNDDQKRVVTPASAVAKGSDFIVVGRPITQADDPASAALSILDEMDRAFEMRATSIRTTIP